MTWQSNKLRDFFQNFDSRNPNHLAAVDMLQSHAPEVMNDDSKWVMKFRERPVIQNSGDRIPQQALDIIKQYEGFRAGPYICPAGVPTIGYGTTVYPTAGKAVRMTDPPVTSAEAEQMLKVSIEKLFLPALERIPHWDEMSDGQKSALISFAYNLGANFYGDYENFGSITRDLKDKNWANVPTTLLKYRNPGSTFEQGLLRRRTQEGALWTS